MSTPIAFDLDPDVNWPTPDEFRKIRLLEDSNLIRETCPSPRAWHFNILDPSVVDDLPEVCKERMHYLDQDDA